MNWKDVDIINSDSSPCVWYV